MGEKALDTKHRTAPRKVQTAKLKNFRVWYQQGSNCSVVKYKSFSRKTTQQILDVMVPVAKLIIHPEDAERQTIIDCCDNYVKAIKLACKVPKVKEPELIKSS